MHGVLLRDTVSIFIDVIRHRQTTASLNQIIFKVHIQLSIFHRGVTGVGEDYAFCSIGVKRKNK